MSALSRSRPFSCSITAHEWSHKWSHIQISGRADSMASSSNPRRASRPASRVHANTVIARVFMQVVRYALFMVELVARTTVDRHC